MTDIVERLRRLAESEDVPPIAQTVIHRAADRIEQLERVVAAADAMRKCNYPSCELCKRAYDAIRQEVGKGEK